MIDEKVLIEVLNKAYDDHGTSAETLKEELRKNFKDLASEHNNGFCEWEIDGVYLHSPHKELFVSCLEEEPHRYKYCPICGKQIKTAKELSDTWKQQTMSRFERVE